jgi:hypothetical protein
VSHGSTVPCDVCAGRGSVACSTCGGDNYITRSELTPSGNYRDVQYDCPADCSYGQVTCVHCGGSAVVPA